MKTRLTVASQTRANVAPVGMALPARTFTHQAACRMDPASPSFFGRHAARSRSPRRSWRVDPRLAFPKALSSTAVRTRLAFITVNSPYVFIGSRDDFRAEIIRKTYTPELLGGLAHISPSATQAWSFSVDISSGAQRVTSASGRKSMFAHGLRRKAPSYRGFRSG